MRQRICCAVLSVMLCVCLTGCGKSAAVDPVRFNTDFEKSNPSGFTAAENSRYTLSWDDAEKRIVFYDKQMDIPWCYTPYQAMEKRYDADGLEVINHPQISSPINITYFDKSKNLSDTVIGYNGSVKKNNFSVERIDSGISITYYFENEQISVTVDYTLREDSLLVTVDPSKISEGDSFLLTSVSIAPFFCSIPNVTDDTYLFVPSGSGALVSADALSADVINITEEMYGSDARRPNDDVIKTVTANARIPVYGAKNGDKGIAAIIEQGAEGTTLCVNTGNANIGYSAVYASFELRSYELMLTNTYSGQRTIYSEEYTTNPVSIGFYPLYGDNAGYVGMAKLYRNYLEKNGARHSAIQESMLNLQILGGTMVTESVLGVPYDTLFPTATVVQTGQMISELNDACGVNMAVQLCGYGSDGLDIGRLAGNFGVSGKLGNRKQMSALSEYCTSQNINLYMDYDVLLYKKSSSAASVKFDSATTTNGRSVTLYYYYLWSGTCDSSGRGWNNTSTFTAIKRALIPEMLDRVVKSANKLKLTGVSLGTLGRVAYSDHSEQQYYAKGMMADQVTQELQRIKNSGMSVMVSEANAYAAATADYVSDAPLKSSGYDIYDTDVPFYQLVFKGFVPMSSSPLNCAGDIQTRILRAVESGTGLSFALSYNYTNDIIDSSEVRYYGSNYAVVKDSVIRTVAEHGDYYRAISGAAITGHELLSDTLRKTVYDNGVTVYVNYGAQAVQTPAGTVDAMSYRYTTGGDRA